MGNNTSKEESRRRKRPSDTTEEEEQLDLFTNPALIKSILSFLTGKARDNARVVPLRRVSKSMLSLIDADSNSKFWESFMIASFHDRDDMDLAVTKPLMAQRPVPQRIFRLIKAACPWRNFVPAAVAARNPDLVLALIKELGDVVESPAQLLKFAVETLAAEYPAGVEAFSPDTGGRIRAHKFFDEIVGLGSSAKDAVMTTTKEIPGRQQPAFHRQHQPPQPAQKEFVKQSVLEFAIFRFQDECNTNTVKAQYDRYFAHIASYTRQVHAGLGLAPRIPLADVEKLLKGPSAHVVGETNHASLTMLDRVVVARTGENAKTRPQDKESDLLLRVVGLLAQYMKRPAIRVQHCALSTAISASDFLLASVIVESGYEVSAPGRNYFTTASQAGGSSEELGNERALQFIRLLAAHKSRWSQGVEGGARCFSPLMRAVAVGDLELIRTLLVDCNFAGEGANVEVRFWNKRLHPFCSEYTALRIASAAASLEMCKLLCEEGRARVDAAALRYANEQTTPEAKQVLLYLREQQKKPQAQNPLGMLGGGGRRALGRR